MAELTGLQSGGQVLDQAGSGQEQPGGADTGDTGRARSGEAGDRRGSGREPGPAETSTRKEYADWLRAARRDRDETIRAADANGLAAEAIARSFGLSRMTVTRIAHSGNQGGRAEPERLAPRVPPPRESGR